MKRKLFSLAMLWILAEASSPFALAHGESLMDKIVSKDEEVRNHADDALGNLDESAKTKLVPDLMRMLRSKDPYTRYYAARSISEFGPPAAPAIPILVKMMGDQGLDGNVGIAATDAFQYIGAKGASPLLKALKDKDMETRRNAVLALGDLRASPKEVIPQLIKAAESKDLGMRQGATRALGKFGSEAAPAVPVLIKALKDKDKLVRSHAEEALESIGTPEALAALKNGK